MFLKKHLMKFLIGLGLALSLTTLNGCSYSKDKGGDAAKPPTNFGGGDGGPFTLQSVGDDGSVTLVDADGKEKKLAPDQVGYELVDGYVNQPYCVSCHNATSPKGGADFSSFTKTMGFVQAGQPASSRYYIRTKDGTMPPSGSAKPSDVEIKLIWAWINNGAKEKGSIPNGTPKPPQNPPANPPTTVPPHTHPPTCTCHCHSHDKCPDKPKDPKDPKDPKPEEPEAFKPLFQQVLKPYCIQCHNSSSAADNVDLTSWDAIQQWTHGDGEKLLVPGKPLESEVYSSIQFGTMPPAGKSLSLEISDKVCQWILEMDPKNANPEDCKK